LEGAESISGENFSADLNQLNQKITGAGKNRWIWPLRIAASVIGIALVSISLIFTLNDNQQQVASKENTPDFLKDNKNDTTGGKGLQNNSKNQEQLALKEEDKKDKAEKASGETQVAMREEQKKSSKELIALQSPKETKTATAGGSGVASAKPTTATAGPIKVKIDSGAFSGLAEVTLASSSIKTDSVAAADTKETEIADEVAVVTPVTQPDFILSESKSTTRSKRLSKESTSTAAAPTQQPAVADDTGNLSGLRKSSPTNLTVNGRVFDQAGQPIPGVNVVVKGSSNGTVTNAEGQYSIALSDQNQTLVYSFVGFVAQEQPADKAKTGDLDVQLKEDATQLSEVVVTGYGTQKRDGEPVVRLAEPVGGMKAYDQYLEDKKTYPQQALDNKVEGKVVVEFTVSTTGALSDFNVVRKIGYGCEEEVIRLVKEGPKWYPSYIDNEAVESLVRVKTRFDLPGKK
jgi:TonB family protein